MASDAAAREIAQQSKAKVFISYSRKDMAFADRLEAALKDRGFEPLIDRTEIYAFEEWWKRIEALIGRADAVVFVLSPDSVSSDVALREVAFAASLNKRFAPVVCRRMDDKAVPEALAKLNFIFFDDNVLFEQSADQLAEALNTDIGWIRQHTEFGEQARRWALGKRSTGLLLRAPVLEEAERWIASRPTNAPTPTDDTQTFIFESRRAATRRRNILSASLGTGLAVALALAALAYWQRGIAIEQEKVANQQRNRAETSLHAATDTSNKLVMDIAVKIRNRLGIPVNLVREILTGARDLLDRISESGEISADLRGGIARALRELATTLFIQGDFDSALEAAERSRDIMLSLVAEDATNVEWQRELSRSYNRVGEALSKTNRRADALRVFQLAFDIRKSLADRAPDNAELQRDLAVSYERIGDEFLVGEKVDEALELYQNAFKIRTTLHLRNPENREWKRDLSVSYEKIGDAQFKSREFEAAKKSYTTSLAIRQSLAAADDTSSEAQRDIALSNAKIGDVLLEMGRIEQAIDAYRLSLSIRQKLVSADPSNMSWQIDLVVILLKLARSNDDALTRFMLADEIARRLDADGKLPGELKTWLQAMKQSVLPH
jgi:tetratricopeptide (TPR) repeat protein